MTWNEGPLLGFDLETTGVDPCSDLPVQVALIRWEPMEVVTATCSSSIRVARSPPGAQAIHGISTQKARHEGCPLGEAAAIVHAALARLKRITCRWWP